jgi:hypothetical protein
MSLLYDLAMAPFASNVRFISMVHPISMLQTVQPLSLVGLAIRVAHRAKTFSLAVSISSLVLAPIGPPVLPLSMLLVALPLPLVSLPTLTFHGGLPIQLVVDEGALEDGSLLH